MANRKKIQLVEELKEKLKSAKAVILVDYQGLTVSQMQELRQKIKAINGFLRVVKNTLLQRAFQVSEYPASWRVRVSEIKGPTAVVMGEEPISMIKVLTAFFKKMNLLKIKIGFVEEKLLEAKEIERIALLPNREALLGQVVYGLKLNVINLQNVLTGNQRKLLICLRSLPSKETP